jgi:NADH dehydrogenase [ubiquinone] 1 alpha subcomplex assembly factor 5
MTDAPQIFDRNLLRQRRQRALGCAANHDYLLRRVAEDFAERLGFVQRQFPAVLNLGSHHGLLSRHLQGLAKIGSITDLDSVRSAAAGSSAFIQADEECLPLADASLDLVVSGLALHLVNDLPGTLVQVCRALKPDGLLLASLLGGATLFELREAWMRAEDEVTGGVSPRVAPFADVRDLGSLLQRAGFALPVADSDIVRVTYATPLALMADIKAMGASNMLTERRRVPVTRGLLRRACEIYSDRFGLADGRVPATFEIITLTAWVPHDSQPKPLQPGSAKMRLAEALGVTEQSTGEKPGGGT